ncbi:MAG: GNAT family N-acetyltransferase, partial [Dehalococcoidia bacterium]|nr:GNAT family N-acetyltransferase [Dehalococcoidia bacterium]
MGAGDFEVARLAMQANADLVPVAANFVRETAVKLTAPVSQASRLAALVEEVSTSIISRPGGILETTISRRPRQVVVRVTEESPGSDLQPGNDHVASLLKTILDKEFADRVRLSVRGDRMRKVEIVKDLPLWDVVPATSLPPATDTVPADPAVEFRLMRPDEGVSLARLVYRCYGRDYSRHFVYSPEAVRRYLLSGLLLSYVAVGPDGEIVGHAALERENVSDRVGELEIAVVDPRYRGQKLLEHLTGLLIDYAHRASLVGLFVKAVTAHTYSQRAALAFGFRETAFLPGLIPASSVPGQSARRRSALVMYRTL